MPVFNEPDAFELRSHRRHFSTSANTTTSDIFGSSQQKPNTSSSSQSTFKITCDQNLGSSNERCAGLTSTNGKFNGDSREERILGLARPTSKMESFAKMKNEGKDMRQLLSGPDITTYERGGSDPKIIRTESLRTGRKLVEPVKCTNMALYKESNLLARYEPQPDGMCRARKRSISNDRQISTPRQNVEISHRYEKATAVEAGIPSQSAPGCFLAVSKNETEAAQNQTDKSNLTLKRFYKDSSATNVLLSAAESNIQIAPAENGSNPYKRSSATAFNDRNLTTNDASYKEVITRYDSKYENSKPSDCSASDVVMKDAKDSNISMQCQQYDFKPLNRRSDTTVKLVENASKREYRQKRMYGDQSYPRGDPILQNHIVLNKDVSRRFESTPKRGLNVSNSRVFGIQPAKNSEAASAIDENDLVSKESSRNQVLVSTESSASFNQKSKKRCAFGSSSSRGLIDENGPSTKSKIMEKIQTVHKEAVQKWSNTYQRPMRKRVIDNADLANNN